MMTLRHLASTAALTALGLGLIAPAASASEPAPTTFRGRLQDSVDAIHRTGTVGVVAQSTGPRGKRHATAGVADTGTGRAADVRDRFRIASTTKTFVATVMLQLVAEGRVSLDDSVERWLPGVVSGNGNDGGDVTVRQLLNHTSGLFNYTADFPAITSREGFEADRYTTWTDEQLVEIAMRHAPDFAPGAQWAYSNTNYILAGMIIEKVTGRSWQQKVTRRVVRPLGLRDTLTPDAQSRIPGPHLRGYSGFGEPGPAIDVTDFNPTAAGAAGAMISTTGDVSRFFAALLGGRLLHPAQLAEMKTTVRAAELDPVWPGARYGLGLMEIPLSCGGVYYSHGGDLAGYTTRDGVSADGRRVVVVEATGDGAPDLSTEKAQNKLIDQELCADGKR
ncbi:alkaline D-peptidase [Streptomyces lincolnensis]|uniref:Alkaline D-peptidase n=1 Tax=Streptomyces lincolnensis TaxID=1915 RepID=A0A1B1MQ57_STRLN|nr:serine hydrolase domain-containing protein [Streptomyces lincolnensis]ANS70739.1 alkaline D-peptidase [Streptomyces lincolnensis]